MIGGHLCQRILRYTIGRGESFALQSHMNRKFTFGETWRFRTYYKPSARARTDGQSVAGEGFDKPVDLRRVGNALRVN